jgi:hypothetical protein
MPAPAPTVTMVVPATLPAHGGVPVAVFGVGFAPGPGLEVRFGGVRAVGIEWHSSTSLLCTFPAMGHASIEPHPAQGQQPAQNQLQGPDHRAGFGHYDPGTWPVTVTNDGGKTFGIAATVTIEGALATGLAGAPGRFVEARLVVFCTLCLLLI